MIVSRDIEREDRMRVLVVENDRATLLGQIGVALEEAGAPQNARDDENHAYLPDLAALMRRFGDADKSVLGVCLGSQLLARAYGAENRIGTAPEFGWCTVALTTDGAG